MDKYDLPRLPYMDRYDLPRLPCMDKSEVNQAVVKFTYFAIFRDGRLQEPAADS